MRIVGGTASGRRIVAPMGSETRPTSERVREALFNSLASEIQGARVLDLYGGSGALSLEALSWGAKSAVVCEPTRRAAEVIRRNARALDMDTQVKLLVTTAEKALVMLRSQSECFDLILCDPPWKQGVSPEVSESLWTVMTGTGWIVVEHVSTEPGPRIAGASVVRDRRYGTTSLSYYRLEQNTDPEGAKRY